MEAITRQYSSADAAVSALQAVSDGRLTEERVDQSVERILRIKLSM